MIYLDGHRSNDKEPFSRTSTFAGRNQLFEINLKEADVGISPSRSHCTEYLIWIPRSLAGPSTYLAVQNTTDRLRYAADDCNVTGNISEVWKIPCWKPTRWIQISGVSGAPLGTPFLRTVLYLRDFLAIMPLMSLSGIHQIPHALYMLS